MQLDQSNEIEQIKQAITVLEGQRGFLGDAVVETALGPLREKLAALLAGQVQQSTDEKTIVDEKPRGEQRKLVTVLFADLVGFTAMSEQMDPEDVRDITNAYFTRWTAAIEQQAGTVEKFIGDAVMAVFGLQTAGESDPENAIRAALAMREQLKELNATLAEGNTPVHLRMRVGIHTGPVVVSWMGERKGQDFVVVGDTVNLASRLQALAPVNGILISHDTYRHVRGVFDVQVIEPVQVKGKRDLVRVYVALQAKPRAFRKHLAGVEELETPLVGREAELDRLKSLIDEIKQTGCPKSITILGEPGIGKSRLLMEFDNWLELQGDYYFFNGRASPAMQNQPFGLLRDLLAYRFEIQDSDPPQIVRQKLAEAVKKTLAQSIENDAPDDSYLAVKAEFIGRLAGFEAGAQMYSSAAEPRQVFDRGLNYLAEYLRLLGKDGLIVILLEDVHWADNGTLDLLPRLFDPPDKFPVCIVCTSRPGLLERTPDWGKRLPDHHYINLEALSEADSQHLVGEILSKVKNLPVELSQRIVRSAEGNPFYVEELIKMLIEDGVIQAGDDTWQVSTSRLASLKIPPTLIEVLQARFDCLSLAEKVFLQRAAVIGRTFWDQAVVFMGEQTGEQGDQAAGSLSLTSSVLDLLRQREIVFDHGESTFAEAREYFFKHALLRDVTYESLLKSYRRIYHGHAARWLEIVTGHGQRVEEFAALIAEHYEQAGEVRAAAGWYGRAGYSAAGRFANAEALRLLSKALELTPAEEPGSRFELQHQLALVYALVGERDKQVALLFEMEELSEGLKDNRLRDRCLAKTYLQRSKLGTATGDYPAAIDSAQKAADFAQRAGDEHLETACLIPLGAAYRYLSEFGKAREVYERALQLGVQNDAVGLQADALLGLGVIAEIQADYPSAEKHLLLSLAFYRAVKDQLGESRVINSLGVVYNNQYRLQEAFDFFGQALDLKRLLGDRFGEGVVLGNLATIAERQYDLERALLLFAETLQVCEGIADEEGKAAALIGIGNIRISLGDFATARSELSDALDICRGIGDRQGEADILTSLGWLEIYANRLKEARSLCSSAIEILQEIIAPSEESAGWFYLGMADERLGAIANAKTAFDQSYEIRRRLGLNNLATDALAGLARCALASGESETALRMASEVLDSLRKQTGQIPGEPALAHLTCYKVLIANEPGLAGEALRLGNEFLQSAVEKITDDELRRSFLENVPANRELLEAIRQNISAPSKY